MKRALALTVILAGCGDSSNDPGQPAPQTYGVEGAIVDVEDFPAAIVHHVDLVARDAIGTPVPSAWFTVSVVGGFWVGGGRADDFGNSQGTWEFVRPVPAGSYEVRACATNRSDVTCTPTTVVTLAVP